MKRLTLTLLTCLTVGLAAIAQQTFVMGNCEYKVIDASTHKLECMGLTQTAKDKKVKDVVIPEPFRNNGNIWQVVNIGRQAFFGAQLESVSIPSTVDSIKASAFDNCQLTTLNIPARTSFIGENVLFYNPPLKEIIVDSANQHYLSYESCLYEKRSDGKLLLMKVPEKREGALHVHTDCIEIASCAGEDLEYVTSVTIPYGVKKIGNGAFAGCDYLRTIVVPSSVTEIGVSAFGYNSRLRDLYINVVTPFENSSDYTKSFVNNPADVHLHVPLGRENAYVAAGWTDFKSYNDDREVAYDLRLDNDICYSVVGTHSKTINGVEYDGTATVVRGCVQDFNGMVTIPDAITMGGKQFAVTAIQEYAFNCDNSYNIQGCGNIEEVGQYAFFNQNKLTSINLPAVKDIAQYAFHGCKELFYIKWGNQLRTIGSYAFANTYKLKHAIVLPVGFTKLNRGIFFGSGIGKLLVPSTVNSFDQQAFENLAELEDLYFNADGFNVNYVFGTTAETARIHVPNELLDKAKNSAKWKNKFTNFIGDACDMSAGGVEGIDGTYFNYTVIDNTPFEQDGTQYAGKVKIVYNPNLNAATTLSAPNVRPRVVYNMMPFTSDGDVYPRYMITELGDSCFAGMQSSKLNFKFANYLTRVGRKAFHNANLGVIELPPTVSSLGADAFVGCYASYITCPNPNGITWDAQFVGDNDPSMFFYVDYRYYQDYRNKTDAWHHNGDFWFSVRIRPCIYATSPTMDVGAIAPIGFGNSGIKAYVVTRIYNSKGALGTKQVTMIGKGEGAILSALKTGTVHMFTAPWSGNSGENNILKATTKAKIIHKGDNTYYYQPSPELFAKTNLPSLRLEMGRAYFDLAGGADSYTLVEDTGGADPGDVNGDGTIDVTDVNLAINVMLGKSAKADYPDADVNGDGTVDVTDVNLIINAMLGK